MQGFAELPHCPAMQSAPPDAAAWECRKSGLLGAFLSGLLARPAVRDELGEPAQGPAALELVDDIDQVRVRVETQGETTVDERLPFRQVCLEGPRSTCRLRSWTAAAVGRSGA